MDEMNAARIPMAFGCITLSNEDIVSNEDTRPFFGQSRNLKVVVSSVSCKCGIGYIIVLQVSARLILFDPNKMTKMSPIRSTLDRRGEEYLSKAPHGLRNGAGRQSGKQILWNVEFWKFDNVGNGTKSWWLFSFNNLRLRVTRRSYFWDIWSFRLQCLVSCGVADSDMNRSTYDELRVQLLILKHEFEPVIGAAREFLSAGNGKYH